MFYFGGRVLAGLLGLASLAIFTRVLTPLDYGRYTVIIAVSGLVSSVVFQWLRQCLTRFGVHDLEKRHELFATIGITFAGLVVGTAAISFLTWWIFFRTTTWAISILMICLVAWVQSWYELTLDTARIDFRPLRYGAASITRAGLTLGLGTAGAVWIHGTVGLLLGVVIGYWIAAFIPAPGILTGMMRMEEASFRSFRRLLGYGAPLSATLGLLFIVDSADRLMLASMRGAAEAGIYAAAYNLSQFSVGTVLMAVNLGGYPLAVKTMEFDGANAASELMGRYMLLLLGLGVPVAVGLALEAHAIGSLLLGNYDPSASPFIIAIVAFAILIAGVRSYAFDVVFMLKRRTALPAFVMVGAALLNIILNLLVIPIWGAVGAAVATLVTFGAAALASFLLGYTLLPIRIPIKDAGKVLVSVGFMAIPLVLWVPTASWGDVVEKTGLGGLVYIISIFILNPGGARRTVIRVVGALRSTGGDVGKRRE